MVVQLTLRSLSRGEAGACSPLRRTVVALAALPWSRLHADNDFDNSLQRRSCEPAVVYTGYLTAVAIAVPIVLAVVAWWGKKRAETAEQVGMSTRVTAAADRLANQMAARWRKEAAQRRDLAPAPVTVRWRWADDDITTPCFEVAILPTAGTGPSALRISERREKLLSCGMVYRLRDRCTPSCLWALVLLAGSRGQDGGDDSAVAGCPGPPRITGRRPAGPSTGTCVADLG